LNLRLTQEWILKKQGKKEEEKELVAINLILDKNNSTGIAIFRGRGASEPSP
jgi:hypothetical protein